MNSSAANSKNRFYIIPFLSQDMLFFIWLDNLFFNYFPDCLCFLSSAFHFPDNCADMDLVNAYQPGCFCDCEH